MMMRCQQVVHTCGHFSKRTVPVGKDWREYHHSSSMCYFCTKEKVAKDYMRELEVRHAFNSECG